METDEFKYDIAFSFLSKDEDTAQQINDLLSDRCRTFIYADKQKEIAFTDGEETFKRVFSKDARIVAVLFRPEWGNTKWTRIEEEGIRGRAYNQGYDFSTFVSMTERVELPDWLPPTRLLFSLPRFGVKGTAAALEARLLDRGGTIHPETIAERGKRLKRSAQVVEEARIFRESETGVKAATTAIKNLVQELGRLATELRDQTGMRFETRAYREDNYVVRSPRAVLSFHWWCYYANTLSDSYLTVKFSDHVPQMPGTFSSYETIRTFETMKYGFRLLSPSRPGWVHGETEIPAENMAEYLMNRLMHHDDKELQRTAR